MKAQATRKEQERSNKEQESLKPQATSHKDFFSRPHK